ncbi:hypothetical protein J2741_001690 [Methanolinea mesophila]|uniref:hypothetical protein n=1 Tax=Methanolinea mesophila TaxID=547055 RepID=UPI001AE2E796|nr:hypothetical protein [Methanolinea mesophila]MBP1929143.1 hypothetical protein [Methanolinea mesophila]
MKYPAAILVAGILAIMLLFAGCTTAPAGNATTTPTPPAGTDPIVGAWIDAPDPSSSVRELWVFKDYGRFDAGVFSADPSVNLSYEIWLTGSWEKEGSVYYNLTGDGIVLDHETMTYQVIPVNTILVYDPVQDVMHPQGVPNLTLDRVSYEPQIPPGINLTFPAD